MLDLNSLPVELHHRISEYVCHTVDLQALRLVNRRFAAAAAWPLFKALIFSGPVSLRIPPSDADNLQMDNVEYGRLHETIEAVHPLARYVKIFRFNPAYYGEDLWQDYRTSREWEMEHPMDLGGLERIEASEDPVDVEYFNNTRQGRAEMIQARRISRPDWEDSQIEEGERFFRRKMKEQVSNAGRISSALKSLFEAMTALEKVEISHWEFQEFKELVLDSRADASSTAVTTESLAEALQSAGKHVKSLHLTGLYPESLNVTPATRHLFASLKHLKLGLWTVGFLKKSEPVSSTFANLFECCRRTLQSLQIIGGKLPYQLSKGAHYLLKMFCDEQDEKAAVFPELRYLSLGSLILSTPSLISFIARQPQLRSLSFSHIFLVTFNVGWPALVSSFPDSVQHWRASGKLGHEPVSCALPPSLVAANRIIEMHPLEMADELPEECEWKLHSSPYHERIDFYRNDNWEFFSTRLDRLLSPNFLGF